MRVCSNLRIKEFKSFLGGSGFSNLFNFALASFLYFILGLGGKSVVDFKVWHVL